MAQTKPLYLGWWQWKFSVDLVIITERGYQEAYTNLYPNWEAFLTKRLAYSSLIGPNKIKVSAAAIDAYRTCDSSIGQRFILVPDWLYNGWEHLPSNVLIEWFLEHTQDILNDPLLALLERIDHESPPQWLSR